MNAGTPEKVTLAASPEMEDEWTALRRMIEAMELCPPSARRRIIQYITARYWGTEPT